eukprot:GEMP01045524.1.p1 GENE.GEMP01045524.1~~GEMP01045524.1.p1  ORF type:complete len:403 (+),score=61.95 GEMP01045524.1:141-1349(+)
MLSVFGCIFVIDAAYANILRRCHVIGKSREFPLDFEEQRKLRTRRSQNAPEYNNLRELPPVKLTLAGETDTRPFMMSMVDRFKGVYFTHEARFPMALENVNLPFVQVHVTIDARTYELEEYLASGLTGHVYRAVELNDVEDKPYVVKFSRKQDNPEMPDNYLNNEIIHEFNMMRILRDNPNVPNAYAMARMRRPMDWCTSMVSDFIGKDLSSLQGGLSLKDTLHYGIRLIRALRQLHSEFRLLHRDIKPANILIKDAGTGFAKDNELFLTDFGAAITYITLDGRHIRFETDADFVGTTRYMSLRAFNRRTSGRQDDMFSALLSLMRLEGSYGSRQHALRARDMTNFDNTWLQNADSNTIPNPFLMFWRATHNTMLGDGPHWQKRPQYETVISAFQEELNRIG